MDRAENRELKKEVVINAPLAEVWKAWTTEEGLQFVSPQSKVELRVDGPYEWFLHLEADELGKRGGQGARILEFVPQQKLRSTWTFPPTVPTLRNSNATTEIEVLFDANPDGSTRIRFTQSGWQEGDDWDAGYAYFDRAWGLRPRPPQRSPRPLRGRVSFRVTRAFRA